MTNVARYNWAVRKLHKRVEQLGAQEFYPRGEGDEQDDDGYVFFFHRLEYVPLVNRDG